MRRFYTKKRKVRPITLRRPYLFQTELYSLKPTIGWRVGPVEANDPIQVIEYEAKTLGNTHLLNDVAKALKCKLDLNAIASAIQERFGEKAQVVWLCRNKGDAEYYYGHDKKGNLSRGQPRSTFKSEEEAHQVALPSNAITISNLGSEGQLWLYGV